jgi:hypothetical protein
MSKVLFFIKDTMDTACGYKYSAAGFPQFRRAMEYRTPLDTR